MVAERWWNALANMTSLYNINPDDAYDGQQRSLKDFQFDLENVLTMSQLVGKSAEERSVASVMLYILVSTKNKTAAEVAVEVVTEAPRASLCICCLLFYSALSQSVFLERYREDWHVPAQVLTPMNREV